MMARSPRIARWLLAALALAPAAADIEDREKCEQKYCAPILRDCSQDRVCHTFAACQRVCPMDRADCLARCAISHGMLPTLHGIASMGRLRLCASRFCNHTFADASLCTDTSYQTLVATHTHCGGATPEHCPRMKCAEKIAEKDFREAWFHCQHAKSPNPKITKVMRDLYAAIESCQRYIQPGCVDDLNWEDPDGDTCKDYVDKGVCRDGELMVTERDLRRGCTNQMACKGANGKFANEACCECGGGKESDDCSSAEAKECVDTLKDKLGCRLDDTDKLPGKCEKYSACFERECSMIPVVQNEELMGTLSCPRQNLTVSASLLFYDVEAEDIEATLRFDNIPSKHETALSHTVSDKLCNDLGWSNAKMVGEVVSFRDSDGDTNTYRQMDEGLVAYVAKGEHGVKNKEGLVPKFHFVNATRTLDDTYGVMTIPGDDENRKMQIITDLARLARLNDIGGLEMYDVPPQACRSGLKCKGNNQYRVAKSTCNQAGARLCTLKELISINDFAHCAIKKRRRTWTSDTCGGDMHLAIQYDMNLPPVMPASISREDLKNSARAVCLGPKEKAFVTCCADEDKDGVGVHQGQIEALEGGYTFQNRELKLSGKGWLQEDGLRYFKKKKPHMLISLKGTFDGANKYSGRHTLCKGGTFEFAKKSLEVTVDLPAPKEGLPIPPPAKYALLDKGLCRCHNGGSPSTVDVATPESREDCIKECEADQPNCRAIAWQQPSSEALPGLCRLFLYKITGKYTTNNPKYTAIADHSENKRCDIVKTRNTVAKYENATCYLKEGGEVHSPNRFYGPGSSVLACADKECHPQLAACQWDEHCVDLILCLANNTCHNGDCLKSCKSSVGIGDAESPEVSGLLMCIHQNRCASNRQYNPEDTDDQDVDIGGHVMRVGYPIKRTKEVEDALAANYSNVGDKFISELAFVLEASNTSRFHFVSDEESDDGKTLLFVFDILAPLPSDPTARPAEVLYRKLKWMVTKKREKLNSEKFEYINLLDESKQIIKMHHHRGIGFHYHPLGDGPHTHHDDSNDGFMHGFVGAAAGAGIVLIVLWAFVTFKRESFLKNFLGLRIQDRHAYHGAGGVELDHLAAEFDEAYPMAAAANKGTSAATRRTRRGGRGRGGWGGGGGYQRSGGDDTDASWDMADERHPIVVH